MVVSLVGRYQDDRRRSLSHAARDLFGMIAPAMRALSTVVLLISGACARAPSLPLRAPPPLPALALARAPNELHLDGRWLRDRANRVVILRGINLSASAKRPPFLPVERLEELDRFPALGINVVRLLFIWEAFEPKRDRYDERYLNRLIAIADAAWKRGIFVIVDIHQDGFSRFTFGGCGDGFPSWAVPRSLVRHAPDNGPECLYWGFAGMSDLDIQESFTAFYEDREDVRTRYLQMLARVVSRFAIHPGVIGYDLLNEPTGREDVELGPLYRDATAVVRAIDPDALVFREPDAARVNLGIGPSRLPAPEANTVYAPHFYDWLLILWNQWSGARFAINRSFDLISADARRWNSPLFVGEFGVQVSVARAEDYLRAIYDRLDREMASGAQWVYTPHWSIDGKDGWNREDYSIVDERLRLRRNFRARPYAQRIAGTPLEMRVVGDHGLLVRWLSDASHETELFAPRALYRGDPRISVSRADLQCAYTTDSLVVKCRSKEDGEVQVRIDDGAPPLGL
jgi:endoglycosylceramidase